MKANKTSINAVIAVFCIYLFQTNIAFAVFGVGDIVSDPGSYTYYVEQIKTATKQFEEMQKQLETAQEIYGEVEDMKKQLIGVYGHADSVFDDLKRIQKEIQSSPTAMLKYAEKFVKHESNGEFEDPRIILDKLFTDPRIPKNRTDIFKELNKKYHAQQKTLEETLVQAETTLKGMTERYKQIEELAGKINGTENVKSAMDLNNRLLIEILKILTEHLSMTTYIAQAQTIINFDGVDDSQTNQIAKDLDEIRNKSKEYRVMGDYLDKRGIDTSEGDNALFKILNKTRN